MKNFEELYKYFDVNLNKQSKKHKKKFKLKYIINYSDFAIECTNSFHQ